MKTLTEFDQWLKTEADYDVVIVSSEDWDWLWNRISHQNPDVFKPPNTIIFSGVQIQRKRKPGPFDVSDRRLFF